VLETARHDAVAVTRIIPCGRRAKGYPGGEGGKVEQSTFHKKGNHVGKTPAVRLSTFSIRVKLQAYMFLARLVTVQGRLVEVRSLEGLIPPGAVAGPFPVEREKAASMNFHPQPRFSTLTLFRRQPPPTNPPAEKPRIPLLGAAA
jgi:hypothetical protein